jgi:hypothetical protein
VYRQCNAGLQKTIETVGGKNTTGYMEFGKYDYDTGMEHRMIGRQSSLFGRRKNVAGFHNHSYVLGAAGTPVGAPLTLMI